MAINYVILSAVTVSLALCLCRSLCTLVVMYLVPSLAYHDTKNSLAAYYLTAFSLNETSFRHLLGDIFYHVFDQTMHLPSVIDTFI